MRFVLYGVFFVAFMLMIGWLVMLLWNKIIADVTGWKELSYWQAVGMLVLFRILFGGFGRKARHWKKEHGHWKTKAKDKWYNMSDEERSEMKARWKEYCNKRRDPL
ncbi:MAG: hypothetical protein AAFO94_04170 [Bacteroidota bacterium]